jgi:putative flavoprotein involved in K+ transport
MNPHLDLAVIGAGQAGLAMGYYLARQGVSFAILDAAPSVGHSWRTRWDSLTLFTPARYSSLPGLPFPAAPEHYPGKEGVADYLEAYARGFSLPVWLDERVLSLTRDETGCFSVRTAYASYTAAQVVVATGPFQSPFVPTLTGELSPTVVQMHSSHYRSPDTLPEGDVLVVGAGNSGVQIAAELARTRRTFLSVGERMPRLPERVLGRSLFWWLKRLGAMNVTVQSRIGRRMSGKELLIGQSPAMIAQQHGVRLVGRTTGVEGSVIRTADGQEVEPAAIVWATGYRPDFRWIELPVLDEHGRPRHLRGVTALPGLYFLGLSWLHTRGSGLIGWVGRDAEYLAIRIAEHRRSGPLKKVMSPITEAVQTSISS